MSQDNSPKPKHLRLVLDEEEDRDTLVDHLPVLTLELDALEFLPTQTFDHGVVVQREDEDSRKRYYQILNGHAELRLLREDGMLSPIPEQLAPGTVIGLVPFAQVKTTTKLFVRVIDLEEIKKKQPDHVADAYELLLASSLHLGRNARIEAMRKETRLGELESLEPDLNRAFDQLAETEAELARETARANAAEARAKEIDAIAKLQIQARVEELLRDKYEPVEAERDCLREERDRVLTERDGLEVELVKYQLELERLRERFEVLEAEAHRLRKDQEADAASLKETLRFIQKEQGEELDELRRESALIREEYQKLKLRVIELVAPAIPKLIELERQELAQWAIKVLDELYALRIPPRFE